MSFWLRREEVVFLDRLAAERNTTRAEVLRSLINAAAEAA
jgi:hypothetical protein